jgi:hypothetical protein
MFDAVGLGDGIDRLALNLPLSLAAIALAALIAAPTQRDVSLRTKIIAVPSVLGGGLGVLSSAMWLYSRTDQPQISLSADRLAVELFVMERAVQTAFFSACTLALAIFVGLTQEHGLIAVHQLSSGTCISTVTTGRSSSAECPTWLKLRPKRT